MNKKGKAWSLARHRKDCHQGLTEIRKGLYCGSEMNILSAMKTGRKLDVLVPLNSLEGSIWDYGFRGEILYYPIRDYGALPNQVLNELVTLIIDRIHLGKTVGVFCLGGHGRIGYVIAAVLGKMGITDPIAFLRGNYCRKAVESNEQVEQIAFFLDKPELTKMYCEMASYSLSLNMLGHYGNFSIPLHRSEVQLKCCNCQFQHKNHCYLLGASVQDDEKACFDFSERE